MDTIDAALLPTFSLRPGAVAITFDAPTGPTSPPWLAALLRPGAFPQVPAPDDARRAAVRNALRGRGFRPSGRSKPASEYLVRAAVEGRLRAILPLVDACNAVSLAAGIPCSLVDLDRTQPPLRIAVPAPKTSYVFNPSGQVIDVGGLPCLWDAAGPCANAVKDAQRTKVTADTRRALLVVWSPGGHDATAAALLDAFREIVVRLGGTVAPVAVRLGPELDPPAAPPA